MEIWWDITGLTSIIRCGWLRKNLTSQWAQETCLMSYVTMSEEDGFMYKKWGTTLGITIFQLKNSQRVISLTARDMYSTVRTRDLRQSQSLLRLDLQQSCRCSAILCTLYHSKMNEQEWSIWFNLLIFLTFVREEVYERKLFPVLPKRGKIEQRNQHWRCWSSFFRFKTSSQIYNPRRCKIDWLDYDLSTLHVCNSEIDSWTRARSL